VVSPTDCKSAV